MTNALGITLEIINNYPWTRLSVRIIGAIKRQFYHMVTHVFDNSNRSQEIFAVDTQWRAVIYFLGHGRKHMLAILPTIWRPGFCLKKDNITLFEYNHTVSSSGKLVGESPPASTIHQSTVVRSRFVVPKQELLAKISGYESM